MSCKGCDIKEEAASFDVEALIAEQLSVEVDLVSEEILVQRLQKCEQCPFKSNHTCTKCGCFYKFRANLAIKNCPNGQW
ncbi:DUF6171 family protein [Enterococcus aquimarinus]|uniref:DUF6171 family protein n=1 Tax=Enterococcus aquimarinus TaxID=328396 RepID=UPI0009004DD7|nr:DUF6171 family protein [Enterococcus aquimarinus]